MIHNGAPVVSIESFVHISETVNAIKLVQMYLSIILNWKLNKKRRYRPCLNFEKGCF